MDGWIGGTDDVLGLFIGLKIWKDLVAGLQIDNCYIDWYRSRGETFDRGFGETSGIRRYGLI